MNLTDALLSRLTRKYDKTAGPALALRLSYLTGQMTWEIADDVLTTSVIGGVGVNLSVDLTQYTIGSLATFLAGQPGYVVLYLDFNYANLSALALVQAEGDINTSNGDHMFVGTNPNWSLFAAYASELSTARAAVQAAPAEMATTTADGYWLDYLGSYYAVPRELGEPDQIFGPRIAAEVILPRQNNVAIEIALQEATGQPATCTDAVVFGNPLPVFDGSIAFDGTHFFNASAARIYNLFDISIGYALTGRQTPSDYADMVRRQIDRLRAAGTHLRNLTFAPSVMSDSVRAVSDALLEHWAQSSFFMSGPAVTSADIALGALDDLLLAAAISQDIGLAALTTIPGLSANLFGAGGFGATTTRVIQRVSAALSGQGLLPTAGTVIMLGRATFAGSSGLATSNLSLPTSALLAGVAGLTAGAGRAAAGVGVFVPSGSFATAASVIHPVLGSATFVGTASLSNPFSVEFSNEFGGGLSAVVSSATKSGAATFGALAAWGNPFSVEFSVEFGEGVFATRVPAGPGPRAASAILPSQGTLQAIGRAVVKASAPFTGTGGVSAIIGGQFAAAAFSGTTGLGATARRAMPGVAVFVPSGAFAAAAVISRPVLGAATFVGTATLSNPFSVEFSDQFGGGLSATVSAATKSGAATFSALAAWGNPFSVEFSTEFGEGVFATRVPPGPTTRAGSAALLAQGSLQSVARVVSKASATFAGGSTLTGVIAAQTTTATFNATASHASAAAISKPGIAVFVATAGVAFAASSVATRQATVTLPAQGALQASAQGTALIGATFTGAGGLTLSGILVPASAALSATAAFTAAAGRVVSGIGVFVPSGRLTANPITSHPVAASASFFGTASLSSPFSIEFSPEFGGGPSASITSQTKAGTASFFGTANWGNPFSIEFSPEFSEGIVATRVPAGPGPRAGSATLAGQGTLQSVGRVVNKASAAIAGAGVFTAIVAPQTTAAAFSGFASLAMATVTIKPGTAVFVPSGLLSVAATNEKPAKAVEVGAGQFVADTSVIRRFQAGATQFGAAGLLGGPNWWSTAFSGDFGGGAPNPTKVP